MLMTKMRAIAVVLALVCIGCETVVEIDPPAYTSELVATSHFSPDSAWSLLLHRSLPIGSRQDASKEYVSGAAVRISSTTGIIDSLDYKGNGWYRSSLGHYPVGGNRYSLQVDVAGESGLKAASLAPMPTTIIESSIERLGPPVKISDYGWYRTAYRVRIRFLDPAGPNFYRLGIYEFFPNQDAGFVENAPDSLYRIQPIETPDPRWFCSYEDAYLGTAEIDSGDGVCESAKVTDRLFDGQEYSWTGVLFVETWGEGQPQPDEFLVILSSLSEDYFEYQRTLINTLYADEFSEPLRVYSNVEGGLGIFAGYANTRVILPLPE